MRLHHLQPKGIGTEVWEQGAASPPPWNFFGPLWTIFDPLALGSNY